jgi:hypothetical protein
MFVPDGCFDGKIGRKLGGVLEFPAKKQIRKVFIKYCFYYLIIEFLRGRLTPVSNCGNYVQAVLRLRLTHCSLDSGAPE